MMARDHRKLRVFQLADRLVLDVYRATADFPIEERYGLQGNLRRSSVSTAVNIVEGSARLYENEYVNFLNLSNSSSAETGYLSNVAGRLGFMPSNLAAALERDDDDLCAGLNSLINAYKRQR
jgi:four helix bundle protein